MTLQALERLTHAAIHATDGSIGSLRDVLFDDHQWVIRYLVVDTGGWLSGREVLISPISVAQVDARNRAVLVNLTRRQVEESPDISTREPVSRQHETELAAHYGYGPYWGASGLWGGGMMPAGLLGGIPVGAGYLDDVPAPDSDREPDVDTSVAGELAAMQQSGRANPRLRSAEAVRGYAINARDGDIGHVSDFIFDDQNWSLRYFVVDTRNWWPGKRVLIAPPSISAISWSDHDVRADLLREQVQASVEYDPERMISPEDEERLRRLYARTPSPR